MRSILVINSNMDNLITVSSMLRNRGYCVIPKTEGGSAFSAVRDGADIDLIIADYMLGDMDALTFMSSLKRIAPARPPVIFLSDRVDVQDYLTAFSLGAFEFLFRPLHPPEFLRIVGVAVRQGTQTDGARSGLFEAEGRGTSATGPLSETSFNGDSRAPAS